MSKIRIGRSGPIPIPIEDRFWKNTVVFPFDDSGCWHWIGLTLKNGYGQIREAGTRFRYLTHRLSLKIHGITLIKGLVVDHICRNRSCVNPKHLRQVTSRINAIENNIGPIASNTKKENCPKGHPYDLFIQRKHNLNSYRSCSICRKETSEVWRNKQWLKLSSP